VAADPGPRYQQITALVCRRAAHRLPLHPILPRLQRALRTFAWKGSRSDTIVFTAQETQSNLERERKRKKDSSVAVEDSLEAPSVRLWTIAIDGKTIRRITDNDDWIEAMALSPDGRWAVTRHQVSLSYEFDQRQRPETHLVDLTSGSREVGDAHGVL
jgi:hypothetical protein